MKYIGVKQVEAWEENKVTDEGTELRGYAVKYPDGYVSWCPKEVFEAAYFSMGEEADGTTVTEDMVGRFTATYSSLNLGQRATVVDQLLLNGFQLVESSICVDPNNYDAELGTDIALNKAKEKIWFALGFVLAWAKNGLMSGPVVDAEFIDQDDQLAEDP